MKDTRLTAQFSQNNKPHYMIQLDALRALAVFAVMLQHFVPDSSQGSILYFFKSILPWGKLGVSLFFVLSGFLITGILLRCRDTIDLAKQNNWFTIKRFYIRRFLRIFPIYYLTLVVTAIASIPSVRETFFWHLTYTSNIYIALTGNWNDGPITHFWSLSVEEQFYLFWPFVILFVPKNKLLATIFITIIIGPLFRLAGVGASLNSTQIYVLTFSCLDLLGIGAILAFYSYKAAYFKQFKTYLCNFGFWVCGPLLIALQIMERLHIGNVINIVIEPTITAFFFVWLIDRAAQGFGGVTGTILELKPLVYLGKISYGIYVYHNFMNPIISDILPNVFQHSGLPYPSSLTSQVFLKTVATLIVAVLSWHIIEKPINDFKKHFGYRKS